MGKSSVTENHFYRENVCRYLSCIMRDDRNYSLLMDSNDRFTFDTNPKEIVMTEGIHQNHSEQGESDPYVEITTERTNGVINTHHVINTNQNGYHNPNAQRHLHRSVSEFAAGSTVTDHQCVTKCTLYILFAMTALSLLFGCVSLVMLTKLWTKYNDLESQLTVAQTSYTAGLADPSVCIPCADLAQGPFDEDNLDLRALIQRIENNTITCCAKSPAQMSILFNLFVKRKNLEKSSLELLNTTTRGNCTSTPPKPTINSTSRLSAHLTIDPSKKQTNTDSETAIRHWTRVGKVSHLDDIELFDDRLRIPETGNYFLYSQVGFLLHYDTGPNGENIDLAKQALFHKVYRYNPSLPNDGSQELLRSEVMQCWEQNKKYGRYTSYVGASIRLEHGDQVYVKVTHLSAINNQDSLTYFGLFKID